MEQLCWSANHQILNFDPATLLWIQPCVSRPAKLQSLVPVACRTRCFTFFGSVDPSWNKQNVMPVLDLVHKFMCGSELLCVQFQAYVVICENVVLSSWYWGYLAIAKQECHLGRPWHAMAAGSAVKQQTKRWQQSTLMCTSPTSSFLHRGTGGRCEMTVVWATHKSATVQATHALLVGATGFCILK